LHSYISNVVVRAYLCFCSAKSTLQFFPPIISSRFSAKLVIILSLLFKAHAAAHEQLAAVLNGRAISGPSSSTTIIKLSVGLAHSNIDELESSLSTPNAASYGNHPDLDEIKQLFGSSTVSKTAVVSWLKKAGIERVDTSDSSVEGVTSIQKIHRLLNTKFAAYEKNGVRKVRTTQYSIPDNLAQHIDMISPTVFFGNSASMDKIYKCFVVPQDQVDRSCNNAITPSCLREMYSIGNYRPEIGSGSRVGFGSFLNRSAIYSDLSIFEQMFNITEQGFSVETINSSVNSQTASSESIGEPNLDVQTIVGISHPLPVMEYIPRGSP
jgi:tripeptidyl-peptidase-1